MKKLLVVLSLFVLCIWGVDGVRAETISPTKTFLQVSPGEELEYEFYFMTENDGEYELTSSSFEYNEKGGMVDVEDNLKMLTLPASTMEFWAEKAQKVKVKIAVPDNIVEKKYLYKITVTRIIPDEDITGAVVYRRALVTLLYLRVGEAEIEAMELTEVSLNYAEDSQGGVESISYLVSCDSESFVKMVPQVRLYNDNNVLLESLKNRATYVFPEFQITRKAYNYGEQDFMYPNDFQKAEFLILDEGGEVLLQEDLSFQEGDVFLHNEMGESPIPEMLTDKLVKFVYNPIFQGIAIIIGLTLVIYSAFLFKKE